MKILVAVDESENSHRAVQYAGVLKRHTPDVTLMLFHVLKPMPRELLEHGGSENPAAEARLGAQLHVDQESWLRSERESECSVLRRARDGLMDCGFEMNRVTMTFGYEDDIAGNILEEARGGRYETIVVGRHGTSRIKRMFGGGVTDQVLRQAAGVAIWVIE